MLIIILTVKSFGEILIELSIGLPIGFYFVLLQIQVKSLQVILFWGVWYLREPQKNKLHREWIPWSKKKIILPIFIILKVLDFE